MAHKFIEVKDILEILYINQNTTGNAVVKITKEKKNKIKWTTNNHIRYIKKKKKITKESHCWTVIIRLFPTNFIELENHKNYDSQPDLIMVENIFIFILFYFFDCGTKVVIQHDIFGSEDHLR